jgi:DNA-binding protein H-NS
MTPLPELIALRDDLNRQIDARQAAERAESVLKAHEALAALGLTPADLVPARVSRKTPRPVAVKYRRGLDTWTGRGKQPVWLRDALAAGAALGEFKV